MKRLARGGADDRHMPALRGAVVPVPGRHGADHDNRSRKRAEGTNNAMTAGEIRSALEGVADDAEVQVRDTTTGVQLSIQAFEEGALVVDLEEEADEGDAADDEP